MGLLDAAFHMGVESTFATKVTATRSYEARTLDPTVETEILQRTGMRKGAQAARHAKTIVKGTTFPLVMDVQKKGMGLLLQALVASTTGPTQVAATTAYTQVHDWGAAGITKSLTCQQAIKFPLTSETVFTHAGAMATGWKIKQSASGLLELEVDFAAAAVDIVTAEATAAYTSDPGAFSWADAVVTLDSATFDEVNDFEFSVGSALKTDRFFLRGNVQRKQPVITGYPDAAGSLDIEWNKTEYYDDFIAGNQIPLNVKWSGSTDEIESGHTYEFELDIAKIVFTGDAPSQDAGDTASQSLPFQVVEPASGALFSLKIKSTDTTL